MTKVTPGSEVEAASMNEFLRLLGEREGESANLGAQGAFGGAVFVARTVDRRPSRYDHQFVVRRVVAAFAHGRDRVSYTEISSAAVELPETVSGLEGRHGEAYEDVRARIEDVMARRNLGVPVREGLLRLHGEGGAEG